MGNRLEERLLYIWKGCDGCTGKSLWGGGSFILFNIIMQLVVHAVPYRRGGGSERGNHLVPPFDLGVDLVVAVETYGFGLLEPQVEVAGSPWRGGLETVERGSCSVKVGWDSSFPGEEEQGKEGRGQFNGCGLVGVWSGWIILCL